MVRLYFFSNFFYFDQNFGLDEIKLARIKYTRTDNILYISNESFDSKRSKNSLFYEILNKTYTQPNRNQSTKSHKIYIKKKSLTTYNFGCGSDHRVFIGGQNPFALQLDGHVRHPLRLLQPLMKVHEDGYRLARHGCFRCHHRETSGTTQSERLLSRTVIQTSPEAEIITAEISGRGGGFSARFRRNRAVKFKVLRVSQWALSC